MPRDAEAWLAERGIEREPIRVTPAPPDAPPAPGAPPDGASIGPGDGSPPAPSAREVAQLAEAGAVEAERREAEAAATRPPPASSLADDVAEGLAFVRRSTATAPQSVGRLRRKLAERDTPPAAIDLVIERAHAERLVDDDAMAAAIVEERRAKGHAPTRLRKDLVARGFDRDTIDRALAPVEAEDQEAAAFAVAKAKADRLTGVEAETAYRRTVGHVARRGYPEGLARKVARQAVDVSRDPARTAGH
ncbi:regulatory protein RecX [Nitriliruptor alkaliphilus]|uniref:regulatory protein RecX n=1 Tax=Nitriliruptor alkaliphilus TaxID=427918 RepID=UPI00069857A3|nr:regulatory protein RecX [Nitriliruptor alkaliphilus]